MTIAALRRKLAARRFGDDTGPVPAQTLDRRFELDRDVARPMRHHRAETFAHQEIGIEIGGRHEVGGRYLIHVLGEIHGAGIGAGRGANGVTSSSSASLSPFAVLCSSSAANWKSALNILRHLDGGGTPRAEIEPVEIEIVMLQRGILRDSFIEEGIAVGGMHPGTAPVEGYAEFRRHRMRAPADAALGFQESHGFALGNERLRSAEASGAGAYDDDISCCSHSALICLNALS